MSLSEQEQRDVYTWLRDIHTALVAPQPAENIYRGADEGPGQNLIDSIRSTLSMTYEGVVERLALLGEKASIDKVVRVARGEGPETRPWAIERAKLIWQKGLSGQSPTVVAARGVTPMPTPISMPTPKFVVEPEVITPEVLPAIREQSVTQNVSQETPQLMLDRLKGYNTFARELNKCIDAFTDKETGEHSK